MCVLQTTLDLLEHGAQVWIPVDGVSSCNAQEIAPAIAVSVLELLRQHWIKREAFETLPFPKMAKPTTLDYFLSRLQFSSPLVQRMRAAGAQITTSESLIFELMKDSKHENFKPISGIIVSFW